MDDSQETIPGRGPPILTQVPDVRSFSYGKVWLAVIEAARYYYADPTRLSTEASVAAAMFYSQNALALVLDLFFQSHLRMTYLDLRPAYFAVVHDPRGINDDDRLTNKRYKTGTGCSAAYVADLVLHVTSYLNHLFVQGHISYSTLAADKCVVIDVFLDAKSHGFLGNTGKVTTCSLHFPQVLEPQSHIAWLPFSIMLGHDDELNLKKLHDTKAPDEILCLRERLIALKQLTWDICNLHLPAHVMLTGDYACMRALFTASRSNYALPKPTSVVYEDAERRERSEYFGYGRPSVWCDASPAAVNAGMPCHMVDSNWVSVAGFTTDEAYPGLLHLAALGLSGAIADAGRALKKLCSECPSMAIAAGVIPTFRELFRDASGNSRKAWDIYTEEPHPGSTAKSFHRAEHTNVLALLRKPSVMLKVIETLGTDVTFMDSLLGRTIVSVLCNAMDIALCLYGSPNLSGNHDSIASIARKGVALDEQWVQLCSYHTPTSGKVATSGLPGTTFLPPYCAHNIAAHLFCQHSSHVLARVHSRPLRTLRSLWEIGGEHLNNLVATVSCDGKTFQLSFAKRATRMLRLLILNCYRRCLTTTDDGEDCVAVVNRSYVE